mmetsp:Transcript_79397/g.200597  ORF Transcript_79397/g.200597 Transcript_79397/m.200597 type:complete len:501 (-) Transcript_79397:7-1509(-)
MASRSVELEDFLGTWRDSLGNHVQVDWARSNNRGGQLDVSLQKPRGGGDPIRLNVKRHYDGHFSCGHYDLDTDETRPDHIVWVDYRRNKRKSIWERDGSPPRGGDRNSWGESGDRGWNRGWEDRARHQDDNRRGGGSGRGGQWDDSRQPWRDSSNGDRRSTDAAGWRGGRDTDRRRQDDPTTGVNAIPVGRPGGGGGGGGGCQDPSAHEEAPPSHGGFAADLPLEPSLLLQPPPLAFPPAVVDGGAPPAAPPVPMATLPHFPDEPLRQQAGGACGACSGSGGSARGDEWREPAGHSLWSGAATPGAWVPPSGPPPPVAPAPAPAGALPIGPVDGDSGNSSHGEDHWQRLIESMYQRYNPEKLQELDRILEKYRGREEELYHALREKYEKDAPPPGMPLPPWGGGGCWPPPPGGCWPPPPWHAPRGPPGQPPPWQQGWPGLPYPQQPPPGSNGLPPGSWGSRLGEEAPVDLQGMPLPPGASSQGGAGSRSRSRSRSARPAD